MDVHTRMTTSTSTTSSAISTTTTTMVATANAMPKELPAQATWLERMMPSKFAVVCCYEVASSIRRFLHRLLRKVVHRQPALPTSPLP